MTGPTPEHISDVPDTDHAVLVNKILETLERNLGIKVTAWERVQR